MSYTILNTDGSVLLTLADGVVDKEATSLDLVGRNITPYGQYLNNNLVRILANSANTSGTPPRSPLTGQLWYDTTARKLKVYDGDFETVSGAIVSPTQPTNMVEGDLWFDSNNKQLNVYDGNNSVLVGPPTPAILGEMGWVLPSTPIHDSSNNTQNVMLLKSYGEFIGMASAQSFTLSNVDSVTYFNTSTIKIVAGLTIKGEISTTVGQQAPLVNQYYMINSMDGGSASATYLNAESVDGGASATTYLNNETVDGGVADTTTCINTETADCTGE